MTCRAGVIAVAVAAVLSAAGVDRRCEAPDPTARLPRPFGLILEKLVTDRTGEKGDRDLLVALGLLMTAPGSDLDEFTDAYRRLCPELRHAVRSNLTVLSLLDGRVGMPDPRAQRSVVAGLLRRLDALEEDAP